MVRHAATAPPARILAQVRADGQPADAKTLQAAREFEAVAIGQLLQPMFATVDSAHSLFGGGAAEETWKPMMVTEIAKKIAAAGGLGLARPVLAEMLRIQEAHKLDPIQRKQTP